MLKGEAYFEVAKNVSRPFVVKTEQLDIKVLGTSFNMKSYPSETQQVTLVQGKGELFPEITARRTVELQFGRPGNQGRGCKSLYGLERPAFCI